MNLTTVNVAISLQQLIGAPLPGGSVRFELTRADINGALVLPKAVTVALPADGSTPTARLWPNTLGTQGSQTKVTVLDQAGVEQFSGLATIPATDCNLHDVMNMQAPPPLDDARAAVLTAQAAAGAANVSAGAAAGSATLADQRATAAAGSATLADQRATAAAGSATLADQRATDAVGARNIAQASASTAVSAASSAPEAQAAAAQATLLAGVSGTYATAAAMTADLANIAANASVLVLADESRQGQTSVYKKLSGVLTYQGVVQYYGATTAGVGDVDPEGTIYLFPGDSTTEQAGATGYLFDTLTAEYRQVGGALERIVGTINFGDSGQSLSSWVNGAASTPPTYSTSNLGVSQNDYFGHKAANAYSLGTELAWRANLAAGTKVVWLPCYGINDCILDASVGNLSQQAITDYIASYLRQAVRRILSAFPKDKIILRTPNPMTARPFSAGAGFPSAAQYPTFGSVDATDQALVEKWNQGIRNGYLAVRNEFPGLSLFDKWELVYGRSDATKTATTQLPYLSDLVHPNGSGYAQEAHQLVSFIAPAARVKRRQLNGRHAWATAYAAADGVNPWEKWPPYLDNNYKYQYLMDGALVARSSSFIDIGVSFAEFSRRAAGRGVYVQVGEAAAQYFATYSAADVGGNLRLFSVTLSAAMQAAATGLPVRIYCDPLPLRAYGAGMEHIQNGRCFLTVPDQCASGGTFSAHTGVLVPSTVTVEVYQFAASVRTLLGTISIGANAVAANMSSGNPTGTLAPGALFEFKVTSATVSGGQILGKFTPA